MKNYKKLTMVVITILFVLMINIPESTALTDCSQIGNNGVITQDTYLPDDLTTNSGDCITFGADNIILDCQEHSITGPNDRDYYGVNVAGRNGDTIKNCHINNFFVGIRLSSSYNNIIRENKLYDGLGYSLSITGNSANNEIENNTIHERVWLTGNGNTINNNIVELTSTDTLEGISIDGQNNTITNNIITGVWNDFGISNQADAINNTVTNNTIRYFHEGIFLGGYSEGNERNIIQNNVIEDNTIGIDIIQGDLNEISLNRIDSTLTYPGLQYLIKKGIIKDTDEAPTEGYGFWLGNSYNNLIWENDVYDFTNYYEEGSNLYCFNGIANEYYIGNELVFNGTIVNQTLCDQYQIDCAAIPACNETLGDGGPFGGEGGGLRADGWTLFNDSNAEGGEARYTRPNNGDQFSWHIHTLPNTFDVYVWKFEANVSGPLASNAKYEIRHSLGTITKEVDWTIPGNEWVYLGRYTFIDNENQGVYLSDSADGIVVADAVQIENIGPPWQNVIRTMKTKIGPELGPFSI